MRLLLAAALILLLTSCGTGFLPGSPAELLEAPTLNTRQAEVSQALEATLNLSDIMFRYPLKGDKHRTPFVFYDLDGDGVEEVIVFYSVTTRSSEIRAKALRRDEAGNWYSFHDSPGLGDQIEFIEFAYLISEDTPCILFGWMNSTRKELQMEIFSLRNGDMEREAHMLCSAYSIVNEPDRLSRLMIVTREKRGAPLELQLLGNNTGTRIQKLASVWLYGDVTDILQMKQSRLWDGGNAVFLDEVMDDDTVATEIIRYSGNSLTLVAGGANGPNSPEMAYYYDTYRPDKLPSVDVDRDGILEVPLETSLPGIEESDEVTPIRLTEYYKPGELGFSLARNAVVHHEAGYLIFFPDRWLQNVTVVDSEANQRTFHSLDPKTLIPGSVLLRIAVYSTQDYEETPHGYIQLGERGATRYYGYLPDSLDEELYLTEEELREVFLLL